MIPLINEIGTLVLDTSYSWVRMFIALAISIVLSLGIGIAAARYRSVERVIIPIVDVLQTLPILAFFPVVIYVVIAFLPGLIGINAAVIFLIITSMLWNMIFGVYEAIKTIPNEFLELGRLYKMGLIEKLRKIFIPASLPGLSEQMALSWAIGLFYLVTSEIFSTGSQKYSVQGIGVALANLGFSGNFYYYGIGIAIFICFVVATRLTFFSWFERFSNRFNIEAYGKKKRTKEIDLDYKIHKSKIFLTLNKAYGGVKTSVGSFFTAKKKIFRGLLIVLIAAIVVIAILYALPSFGESQILKLPSYELTAASALLFSFLRVWGALLAILVVAIPVSIYVVFIAKHKQSYLLLFQTIASIPATILLPLLVFEIGNNAELIAFIVFFLSGIWYVIFSIIASTKTLPASISEVKRVFRVKGKEAWTKIYLKAIAPGLITGIITGVAAEWNASIVAEYFSAGMSTTTSTAVGTGIGKLLDTSLSSGNLYLMIIALINMTVMIILLNTFVWKKFYQRATSVYI
jgi:NitT/TauT family transport system permease protein